MRIGGGATWGQVATALAPHGLAISSGDTTSVGVGGLTLTRRHRLEGQEVRPGPGQPGRRGRGHGRRRGPAGDAEEHPDLFCAIRGGGGNFGIVTAFEFAAHPTTDVFHGTIAFPAAEAARAPGLGDYLRSAPDELTSIVVREPVPGGPEAPVEIHVVFDGDDPELAARAIDPIRRLGTVLGRRHADAVRRHAGRRHGATPGHPVVTRNAFVDKESVSDVLRILTEVGASERSPFIAVRSIGGAVSRVADDATAYAHRQAELMFMTIIAGPAPVVAAARPGLEPSGSGSPRTSTGPTRTSSPGHRRGRRGDVSGREPMSGSQGQAALRPGEPVRGQPQRPADGA